MLQYYCGKGDRASSRRSVGAFFVLVYVYFTELTIILESSPSVLGFFPSVLLLCLVS